MEQSGLAWSGWSLDFAALRRRLVVFGVDFVFRRYLVGNAFVLWSSIH